LVETTHFAELHLAHASAKPQLAHTRSKSR
jgi:hypothetical protein